MYNIGNFGNNGEDGIYSLFCFYRRRQCL